jgi:hypothetical protein
MILVNGDSFTFGDGLSSDENPWPYLMFGSECKNIGESGSSNSSIVRRSLEEIYLNQFDKLIIGWSSLGRIEISDQFGKAKTVLFIDGSSEYPGLIKDLVTNFNEFWYFKQFLILLSTLSLHCQKLGVQFFCFNAVDDIARCYAGSQYSNYHAFHKICNLEYYHDSEIQREFAFITKLKEETNKCWILPPNECIKQFYQNNVISKSDLHPNQVGHNLIAQRLGSLLKF